MKHFWLACVCIASAGLFVVVVPNDYSEMAMAFVDLAHSPAKARAGETY